MSLYNYILFWFHFSFFLQRACAGTNRCLMKVAPLFTTCKTVSTTLAYIFLESTWQLMTYIFAVGEVNEMKTN